mmetsp:Transcript_14029/g.21311  ORF Transcript_14029/g.21311 Transcript_14029/m.21311 type:complete len:281 (-) Transcript_14029:255-1097(-)
MTNNSAALKKTKHAQEVAQSLKVMDNTEVPSVIVTKILSFQRDWTFLLSMAGVCMTFLCSASEIACSETSSPLSLPESTNVIAEQGEVALLLYRELTKESSAHKIERFRSVQSMLTQLEKLEDTVQHHQKSNDAKLMGRAIVSHASHWILSHKSAVLCHKIEEKDQTTGSYCFILIFVSADQQDALYFGFNIEEPTPTSPPVKVPPSIILDARRFASSENLNRTQIIQNPFSDFDISSINAQGSSVSGNGNQNLVVHNPFGDFDISSIAPRENPFANMHW